MRWQESRLWKHRFPHSTSVMKAIRFEIKIPVRYYEADPMGVVHHSEYVRYFECARNQWLDSVGYGYQRSLEEHLVFPVVELDCSYRKSACFGQVLTVTMELTGFNKVTATFHQQVLDSNGEVCADGNVTVAFLNTRLGHVVRCPEYLCNIIDNQIID